MSVLFLCLHAIYLLSVVQHFVCFIYAVCTWSRFQNQIVKYLPLPPHLDHTWAQFLSVQWSLHAGTIIRMDDSTPTLPTSLIHLKRSVRRDRNTSIRISRSRKYKTMPITRAHLFDIWILKVFFGQWGVWGLNWYFARGTAQVSPRGGINKDD